jgi:hypothetical protein
MTDEQRAVLLMVFLDPDAFMQNAVSVFGEARANEVLIENVAIYQAQYDAAITNGTYKTRAQMEAEYENSPEYLAEQARIAALQAVQRAKMQAIIDNLPSWSVVGGKFDTMLAAVPTATNAELKGILFDLITITKKLARVVYWEVKNTEE